MAPMMDKMPQAALGCMTNFSFLRGASHPAEMIEQAASLGWQAVGISDMMSCAGLVRAHMAAKQAGIRLICGVHIRLQDGYDVICYAPTRAAYETICQTLSAAAMKQPHKASVLPVMHKGELARLSSDTIVIILPDSSPDDSFAAHLGQMNAIISARLYVGAYQLRDGCDGQRLARIAKYAEAEQLGMVALAHALYHVPRRRPVADILSCIRHKTTLAEAGYLLSRNAERHILTPQEMLRRWQGYEQAVYLADRLSHQCQFSLDELSFEYPESITSQNRTPMQELAFQVRQGSRKRYPDGVPDKVVAYLAKEMALIEKLDYAPFFLTVFDIVRFARSRNILCQGRGSAANSAVCYCLFITAVDPERSAPLLERFISETRNEPPDIDVDFEHHRREEIIQYIYHQYGRHRAGLAAAIITYRGRSALVEIAKAFGLSRDVQKALSAQVWGREKGTFDTEAIIAAGLDPEDRALRHITSLAAEIQGFPRHLSQHVGGFVIVRDSLDKLCVIRPAAMQARSIIEWDKDDLDALGLLKVDVLALGMLSCIQGAFHLLATYYQRNLSLATIPPEDNATYDMLCRGDSIGVFQVESRAQMAMLPRLQPRCFHDLIVQVAIVRPGPIQGDMVHPYLRRRAGREQVEYPSVELRDVLERTLGVPLFQEQAMKIAIVGAGFTGAEADQLRRAMATFKKNGDIHRFYHKMVEGMIERGYDPEFARRCFKQIEGFGTYGFPESHAASFALLVYVSAWLKCHYPEIFCCALLNAQPMGFYRPAQLVADARSHGVEVRPVDVNYSEWDSTLEPTSHSRHALRLGLRLVKGLAKDEAGRLAAARLSAYQTVQSLITIADISVQALQALAAADAFTSLGLDARQAGWQIKKLARQRHHQLPLFADISAPDNDTSQHQLPTAEIGEKLSQDYHATGLSLKAHPVDVLAGALRQAGWLPCSEIAHYKDGRRLRLAGLVTMRQRPGTAKGTVFVTIEDGQGSVNVIVWHHLTLSHRSALLGTHLMGIVGRVQREGAITHFIAETLVNCDQYLEKLQPDTGVAITPKSRDFH